MLERYPEDMRHGATSLTVLIDLAEKKKDLPDDHDSHEYPLSKSPLPEDGVIDSPSFIKRALKAADNFLLNIGF